MLHWMENPMPSSMNGAAFIQHATRHALGNADIGAMQVDDELIASQAAQHVCLAQATLQAFGHQFQHAVAKGCPSER